MSGEMLASIGVIYKVILRVLATDPRADILIGRTVVASTIPMDVGVMEILLWLPRL